MWTVASTPVEDKRARRRGSLSSMRRRGANMALVKVMFVKLWADKCLRQNCATRGIVRS
jgi:hypothetical protein